MGLKAAELFCFLRGNAVAVVASNKIPSESCFSLGLMSPLRLGIQTRQTLTKLRVSAGAEEKHSTLAPSSSCVCAVCGGNDEAGIPAGRKHWLFHHDDFEWRPSSSSLSSLLFFPSAEERMCWYTPHRHSRTKGTNNSYRVKDAITLFEKVRVLVATVRPPSLLAVAPLN